MQKSYASLISLIGCFAIAFCFSLGAGSLEAQDEAEQKTYERVDSKDEKALRENLGKKVTVFGLIKRVKKWDGGANFLNFDGDKFMLICFESEYPNFPDGQPADVLKDKNVEVTGYVNEYKGKLQIKLTHPAQVKIVEPVAVVDETAADDKKKEKKDEEPKKKPGKVDPKKYFC